MNKRKLIIKGLNGLISSSNPWSLLVSSPWLNANAWLNGWAPALYVGTPVPRRLLYNKQGDYYYAGKLADINVTGHRYLPRIVQPLSFGEMMLGIDAVTGPLLHLVQPSLYVGAVRDAINGNNPFVSLMRGNTGIFNENFTQEHPYLSMFTNNVADITALNKLSGLVGGFGKTSSLSNEGSSLSSNGKSSSFFSRVLSPKESARRIKIDNNLFPYVIATGTPAVGAAIGSTVGDAIGGDVGFAVSTLIGNTAGAILGFKGAQKLFDKNITGKPFFPLLYRMANDIIQRPASTLLATIRLEYPWTRRLYFRNVRGLYNDIGEARLWLQESGYPIKDLPKILILKHNQYEDDVLGRYQEIERSPFELLKRIRVQPTSSKYSNLPLHYIRSNIPEELRTFRGLVNHELEHGRQRYYDGFSERGYGYYVPKSTLLNMRSIEPFRNKTPGSWDGSPDEFDSELSNLLITTGKSAMEPVDDIRPLARRFGITSQEARDFERDILHLRRAGTGYIGDYTQDELDNMINSRRYPDLSDFYKKWEDWYIYSE